MNKHVIDPWKKACQLRPEIRQRHLTASDFAVDLHKVVNGWPGGAKPYYCDPAEFFSTTYATENLRQFCRVVLRRLARENGGEAIINVAQTFGGGKSHTLTSLFYLTTLGKKLPKDEISVKAILNEAKLNAAPEARVAAVSFDKVDWVKGCEVSSPNGKKRAFRMPWNLIAWQLLGEKGIAIIDRDESNPDHNTPPADTLWAQLLHEVEREGKGALILLDEFLMWAHDAASSGAAGITDARGPAWYDRLKNFFQRLAQAVESSERSCLVVSLLASDPDKMDNVGKAIMNACNNGLNRQASLQQPVERNDLPELLRQRMFAQYPKTFAEREAQIVAFWENMKKCEPGRCKNPEAQKEIVDAYPFHPLLLDRFFGKWSDLKQFQKTRGVLQIFAMALRDAEAWDDSPLVGPQVFLAAPGKDGLSEALNNLAAIARDSDDKLPPWPMNLQTELPRALTSQKVDAGTLSGREIEAACVAAFIFSQPLREQAELNELRWMLAPTVELPAVLNNGLTSWSKNSWYLEACEATEAATGVPKFWRLGPKPNLNQLHDSFKKQALKHARSQFDELVKKKIAPLEEGFGGEISMSKLPSSSADVEDTAVFRVALLGADYAGIVGDPPDSGACAFLRNHSSPSDIRLYQNILLVVTPSRNGLALAEDAIADWMAWSEIEGSNQFKELDSFGQEQVRKTKRTTHQQAQTAVKNAYELVLYVDKAGVIQAKKITLGAQTLLDTLKQERDLRIFDEKIDASAIMPGGLYPVWTQGSPSMVVADLYQEFGKQPAMPKLMRRKTVLNTIEDAVRRGLLALRISRSDGSEIWFWRSGIDVVDWDRLGEAWLPDQSTLNALAPGAVAPGALPGLWPEAGAGVKLSAMFSWFDGTHHFEEVTEPGYPPENRPVPKADFPVVKSAAAKAIEQGALWLVFGNDSIFHEPPTPLQLDPDAMLYPPPRPLVAIDLLPGNLADAWTTEAEPQTTVGDIYSALKTKEGKPWPVKKFIETVNAALGQGYMRRVSGTGAISTLEKDGSVALVVKSEQLPPPELPPTIPGGRRGTSAAKLSIAELQDFADHVSEVMKALAGTEPEIEVRVTIHGKAGLDVDAANQILDGIKKDWRF